MAGENESAIEKKTMTTLVTERLRRDILQGRFAPEQHVTVQSISATYQTSAIPAREAFSILSGEDLLDIVPYKGVVIHEVNRQTVQDIYGVLRAMEVLMIESIEGHWTQEMRENIFSVNEQIRSLSTLEEVHDKFNDLNRAFHDPLEQFCTNGRARRLRKQYHDYITIITETGRTHSLDRVRQVYSEHCSIISALDSGNMALIREAYIRHSINAETELMWQLNNKYNGDTL